MDRTQFNALTRVMAEESALGRRRFGGWACRRSCHHRTRCPRGESPAVSPQETTPESKSAVPPVLQEWAAAWSEHDDGARLAALYTSDATHEEVPSGTIFAGPEEIAGYAQSHFAAFPDVALELTSASRLATGRPRSGSTAARIPGACPGYHQAPASPSP